MHLRKGAVDFYSKIDKGRLATDYKCLTNQMTFSVAKLQTTQQFDIEI